LTGSADFADVQPLGGARRDLDGSNASGVFGADSDGHASDSIHHYYFNNTSYDGQLRVF
jgi:hypothetical protein